MIEKIAFENTTPDRGPTVKFRVNQSESFRQVELSIHRPMKITKYVRTTKPENKDDLQWIELKIDDVSVTIFGSKDNPIRKIAESLAEAFTDMLLDEQSQAHDADELAEADAKPAIVSESF